MKELFARKNALSITFAAKLVSAAIITGFLYYGRVVLIPLALASLIAFALNPVVRKLVGWRLPRGLAVGLVVTLLMVTLGGLGWFVGGQLTGFANELPAYRDNIAEKIKDARRMLTGGVLDKVKDTVTVATAQADPSAHSPVPDESENKPTTSKETTASDWLDSIGMVTDPLTTFGLVILLVAMMLLQWPDLRARLLGMASGKMSHTTNAIADASKRVGHFLFLQFVYNTTFGIVVGVALLAIGVPYAPLWGLCAALFRYVPYIGPLFATVLPLAVSLVTSSGWGQVTTVGLTFLVLELISNNFVEPWLYGSKLGVSEIGIIMASVAWTYLWGPTGLLLATPLTVILVVLGKHVPSLAFFAKLLGNDEVLSGPERYYQRLLAGDLLEASERAEKLIRHSGRANFVSDTLLPALAHARRDQVAGWLTDDTTEVLLDEVKAVSELLDDESVDRSKPGAGTGAPVVLWSTCPLMDAALPILEQELRMGNSISVKSSDLIGSTLQQLAAGEAKPRAISILHLSEVDTPRALAVLKRIKQVFPDVPVQISRLGEAPFTVAERSSLSGASSHAASVAETRAWATTYAATAAAV